MADKSTYCKVSGVDDEIGLVFGYAIVCLEEGEEYFDLHNDHIPESSMLKAATDFMENSRIADEMHDEENKGSIVFAFPMTTDIAKSLDIEVKKTGLLIAMKPSDESMLAKFKDGTYTGFSIGGTYIENEEV